MARSTREVAEALGMPLDTGPAALLAEVERRVEARRERILHRAVLSGRLGEDECEEWRARLTEQGPAGEGELDQLLRGRA